MPTLCASRLQRYAMFLSGYQYELVYIKSEKNVADCLSRLPLKNSQQTDQYSSISYLNFLNESNLCIDVNLIKLKTKKDRILKLNHEYSKGWPSSISNIEIKPYFKRKNEITLESEILMWGHKVIIPKCLQEDMLKELHSAHFGIVKMKSLARS